MANPTPNNTAGTPALTVVEQSAHEQLSLANGSLGFSMTVASFPQRGGRSLNLGLVYSTNETYSLKEKTHIMGQHCPGAGSQCFFVLNSAEVGWVPNRHGPWYGSVHVNVPTLSADRLFVGDNKQPFQYGTGIAYNDIATYCLTNWTFTDWQGAAHSFPGFNSCDNNAAYLQPQPSAGGEASDGSGYTFDARARTDPIVRGPDGVIYHFLTLPEVPTGYGSGSDDTHYNQYASFISSEVDRNGNAITVSSSGSSHVLTDTMGRQITFTATGYSWSQQGEVGGSEVQMQAGATVVSSTTNVPFPYPANESCVANSGFRPDGSRATIIFEGTGSLVVPDSSTWTITLQDGSFYTLYLDARDQLTKVAYPAGGYTSYDYATVGYNNNRDEGDMICSTSWNSVIAKHECPLSDGSCTASQPVTDPDACVAGTSGEESTTCYSGFAGNYNWGTLTVKDPVGGKQVHTFDVMAGPSYGSGGYRPPLETKLQFYDSSGTVLRTVDTVTGCNHQGPIPDTAYLVPCSQTTTINDVSPVLSSTRNMTFWVGDLPLSTSETDFSGSVIRNITYSYKTGGIFDESATPSTTALNHILDFVQSQITTETVTAKSLTVTRTPDSFGNIMKVVTTSTGSGTQTTKVIRNGYGDVTESFDPMQFAQTHSGSTAFGYGGETIGNCPQNNGPGLPTSSIDALNHKTLYSYFDSGLPACVIDSNGQITMFAYDSLGRISKAGYPDGGNRTIAYTSSAPLTISTTIAQDANHSIKSKTILDGFGRTFQRVTSAPEGDICTETFYDAVGRTSATNNPRLTCQGSIASGSSVQYKYDMLGRLLLKTNEDATKITSSYAGVTTDLYDETNHHWSTKVDAFGRLAQVFEPDASNTPTFRTQYTYDGFGNLTEVSQDGAAGNDVTRLRRFSYDGLSRLVTSSNPETGLICYGSVPFGEVPSDTNCTSGYDDNGNLEHKTDARGVFIQYTYDALNRLTGKQYSDGTPPAAYGYDGHAEDGTTTIPGLTNPIGRLSHTTSGGRVGVDYGYDPMGRLSLQRNCLPLMGGWCGSFGDASAHYDLAGNLDLLTYPDKRTVKQGFDTAGRMNSVAYDKWYTNTKSQAYLTVDTFDSAGHIIGATFGNGVKLASGYDSRERILALSYNKGIMPLWSKKYTWYDDSNLQRENDPLAGTQRQFAYDNLNRLTSAQDVISATTGSNGAGISGGVTPGTGGGPSPAPGASGAVPWWTNPDDSNILPALDSQTTPWDTYNAVLTPDNAQAPDGTMTAATLIRLSSGGLSYTFGHSPSTSGVFYSGETLAGSVWLRSPSGTQTVAIEVSDRSEGNNFQSAQFKPVTVTSAWQQFQVVGTVRPNVSAALFQVFAGVVGQPINVWNPMLEDLGVAGSSVTNLAPYSQRLTASSWETPAGSVTDNTTTAPDGTLTASTLILSGQTGSYVRDIVPNAVPLNGMSVASSVWLRCPSGSQSLLLALLQSDLSGSDIPLGTATVTVTDKWQRFQIVRNALSSAANFKFQIGESQGVQTLYVWGTQIEVGSVAGPYVATGATPVNRPTAYTNLLPFSQQPNQSSWVPTQLTATSNVDTAPDGTHSAAMVTGTSDASDGTLLVSIPNPNLYNEQVFTASVYLRCLSGTMSLNLYMQNHGSDGYTLPALKTADLTTSWKRFQFTGTFQNGLQEAYIQIGGGGSITANTSFEMWGAQVELAPQAGPYVATSALPIITGRDLTNILPNSQQLNGPGWYPVANGSVSTNANSSPDQTSSAATVTASNIPDPNTSISVAVANPSLYDEQVVTASVFLRSRTGLASINLYLVQVNDGGSNYNTTAKTVNLTSSWQRYELTGTMVNGMVQMYLQLGGGFSVTQGQSFDVWGPQLVIGSEAGPYTPSGSTPGTVTNFATNQPGSLSPYGLNETYQYDSFGNITQHGNFTATYTANNQMFGYAYDQAGNLLSNGYSPMTWDAENRLSTVGGTRYTYDAEGRRVSSQGADTPDTIYFGDRPIQRLVNNQLTDLIYGPTGLIAEVPATEYSVPVYHATDHLGSAVGSLTSDGSLVNPIDLTPFGKTFSGITSDPFVFTGKERDAESGLDYFGARYYGSSMGRFISPDWSAQAEPVPYAKLADPQSLNLYAYVENNPLRAVDIDGHFGLNGGSPESCFSNASGSACATSREIQASIQKWNKLGEAQQQNVSGSNKTFRTADGAATAALDAVNGKSDEQGVEYGGRVFQTGPHKFGYTSAVTQGHAADVNVDDGAPEGSRIPAGSTNAGIYHTHPPVPGKDPYRFSYADVYNARHEGVPNYVERPDGSIVKFDFSRTPAPSLYDPNKQVFIRP